MDMLIFHSWWTVALLVLFVGIVIWAWNAKRKPSFDAAARIPLEDDDALHTRATGESDDG